MAKLPALTPLQQFALACVGHGVVDRVSVRLPVNRWGGPLIVRQWQYEGRDLTDQIRALQRRRLIRWTPAHARALYPHYPTFVLTWEGEQEHFNWRHRKR